MKENIQNIEFSVLCPFAFKVVGTYILYCIHVAARYSMDWIESKMRFINTEATLPADVSQV